MTTYLDPISSVRRPRFFDYAGPPPRRWEADPELEIVSLASHPMRMKRTYPDWLKVLAVLAVITLVIGFGLGLFLPGRWWATIMVPIGLSLWWLVIRGADWHIGYRG